MTNTPSPKIDQIGMVVSDLDRAITFYESLGFGPFVKRDTRYLSRKLYGKPVPPDVRMTRTAAADAGPVQLELIQPVAEGTHWMATLKEKGGGVNHFGAFTYSTEEFDAAAADLRAKGVRVVYECSFGTPGGAVGRAIYLDTGAEGGVLYEIIQKPPPTASKP